MTNNTTAEVSEADVAIAAVLDEYFPLGTAPQIVLAAASAVRAAMQSERLKGGGEVERSLLARFVSTVKGDDLLMMDPDLSALVEEYNNRLSPPSDGVSRDE